MKIPDFEGLTPAEMHELIYDPLGEKSIISIADDIPDKVLDKMTFFILCEELLARIHAENGLKLTQTGNLPVKLVKVLFSLELFQGIFDSSLKEKKNLTETDFFELHVARIILKLSGYIRKTHNKLYLTRKAQKLFEKNNRNALMKGILTTYCTKYNWAYADGFSEDWAGIMAWAFTVRLIRKYGEKERKIEFYTEKYLNAFPAVLTHQIHESRLKESPSETFQRIYRIRTMNRFLEWFGMINMRLKGNTFNPGECYIQKTDVIDRVFTFSID